MLNYISINTKARNSGIDLLRVILSFNVIIIHLLFYGGPQTHMDPSNPAFYILWLLGLAIICTVNCFALISGYLAYGSNVKYSNIIRLYLIVLYYSIAITLFIAIFFPEETYSDSWSRAFFPISTNTFWYFTAYFGLFAFSPLLVYGMKIIQKPYADALLIFIFLAFSVLPTVSAIDPFLINKGYSMLWITAMFIVGMYLKKYDIAKKIKKTNLISLYIGSIAITCIGIFLSLGNPNFAGARLMEYNSPTTVIAAISIVLLFSSIQCRPVIQKMAAYCSPIVFSVYLIHEHPFIRNLFIYDCLLPILDRSPILQLIAVFGSAMLIWLTCFCLDHIRQTVFKFCGIEKLIGRISDRVHSLAS